MRARLIVAAVIVGLTVLVTSGAPAQERCDAPGITSDYDTLFQIAARRWMPIELRNEWCVQKALCVNESRLDPDAMSPAHAIGLCQVLAGTAADVGVRGTLRDARNNIKASALTFDRYWNFWATPRSTECRLELALASYNAGPGNIHSAQRLSGGRLCWERIRPHLVEVTGKHALETANYVTRFWSTWRRLRGYTLG